MHVAMYAPALPATGSANGIVTYARIMQQALTALGHHCTVFDHDAIEHADGRVEHIAPDRGWRTRLSRALAARRNGDVVSRPLGFLHTLNAVRRIAPIDVLEMEESFGWVGRLDLDIPVVARLHGPHIFGKDEIEAAAEAALSRRRIAAEGAAIAKVAGITSPSARLMQETLRFYDHAPERTAWIPNPIPIAPPDARWSIDRCDRHQLLFVGRFDLRKGADIVVEAFARAAEADPDLRLVMCGPDSGVALSTGERLNFADWTARYVAPELRRRITYRGPMSPAGIAQLRLQSALCVSASRFETFHYSSAEGLAVGAPVLASDTFGMVELIRPEIDGFIAPVGDVAAVAAAITDALADPARLAAVGAAGLALCERVLSPTRVAARTVEFYRSLR